MDALATQGIPDGARMAMAMDHEMQATAPPLTPAAATMPTASPIATPLDPHSIITYRYESWATTKASPKPPEATPSIPETGLIQADIIQAPGHSLLPTEAAATPLPHDTPKPKNNEPPTHHIPF
jgi:hypothetical protein